MRIAQNVLRRHAHMGPEFWCRAWRAGMTILVPLSLAACTAYINVPVTSATAPAFHYVRADIWEVHHFDSGITGAQDPLATYGTYNTGDRVPFAEGRQYVIVPICSGKPNFTKLSRPVVLRDSKLHIDC